MVAYHEARMEEADDDPAFIAVALGNIARAYGMVRLVKDRAHASRSLQSSFRGRQIQTQAQSSRW